MQPTPRALALKEPVQRVLAAVKGEILDTGSFDPATEIRPYTIATLSWTPKTRQLAKVEPCP
jgi:hypothetical protein